MGDSRFAELAFRRLPLACLAAAAVAGGMLGPRWSARAAPLPWLVALAVVGLAHGATDLAVSKRCCPIRAIRRTWAAYAAAMAAVVLAYGIAPVTTIVSFVLLSAWHFGHAATEVGRTDRDEAPWQPLCSAMARGGIMLGVPLAGWPEATSCVATTLLRLTGHEALAAAHPFPSAAVRGFGLVLVAVAAVGIAVECITAGRVADNDRRSARALTESAVIASLGLTTDPLFSVGMSFLVWHAWRQMEPLAEILADGRPASWPELVRAVIRIHVAALPLLMPAWLAVGGAWWLASPTHSARDLAILSIGAYLVVTPAHELLDGMLVARSSTRPTASCPKRSVSCSA